MLPFFHKHANIRQESSRETQPAGLLVPAEIRGEGEHHMFLPNPIDEYVWAGHCEGEPGVKSVTY